MRGDAIFFREDGKKFYVDDWKNEAVYEYTLSVPWDVETLQWSHTLDISKEQKEVRGIEISRDGKKMWLVDTVRNDILEYELEKPWELHSAKFQNFFSLKGISQNTRGIRSRADGLAFYITSTAQNKIHQFSIR